MTHKERQIRAGTESQVIVLDKRKRMNTFNRKYRRKCEEPNAVRQRGIQVWGGKGALGENDLAMELLHRVCGAEIDGAG